MKNRYLDGFEAVLSYVQAALPFQGPSRWLVRSLMHVRLVAFNSRILRQGRDLEDWPPFNRVKQPRQPGRRAKRGGLAVASLEAQAPLTSESEPPAGNTGVETALEHRRGTSGTAGYDDQGTTS